MRDDKQKGSEEQQKRWEMKIRRDGDKRSVGRRKAEGGEEQQKKVEDKNRRGGRRKEDVEGDEKQKEQVTKSRKSIDEQ